MDRGPVPIAPIDARSVTCANRTSCVVIMCAQLARTACVVANERIGGAGEPD